MNQDIIWTSPKKSYTALTENQEILFDLIQQNIVTIASGKPGTGKTFCAVLKALQLIKAEPNNYKKLILIRPVIESSSSLGFLPGTLLEKLGPYLTPLYDIILELTGFDFEKHQKKTEEKSEETSTNKKPAQNLRPLSKSQQLQKRKILNRKAGFEDFEYPEKDNRIDRIDWSKKVEVKCLSYLRGTTISNSIIILDEAQNATIKELKLLLTRIGKNTKVILCGDVYQNDINKNDSSLEWAVENLTKVDKVDFIEFDSNDIVRSGIVRDLLEVFETHGF